MRFFPPARRRDLRIALGLALGLWALGQGLSFPKSTLFVEQGGKRYLLRVEVADTPERQAQGLMFRKSLGEDEGMVFLFPTPHGRRLLDEKHPHPPFHRLL